MSRCMVATVFNLLTKYIVFPKCSKVNHTVPVLISMLLNIYGGSLQVSGFLFRAQLFPPWYCSFPSPPWLAALSSYLRVYFFEAFPRLSFPMLWPGNCLKAVSLETCKAYLLCFLSLRRKFFVLWYSVSWKPLFQIFCLLGFFACLFLCHCLNLGVRNLGVSIGSYFSLHVSNYHVLKFISF